MTILAATYDRPDTRPLRPPTIRPGSTGWEARTLRLTPDGLFARDWLRRRFGSDADGRLTDTEDPALTVARRGLRLDCSPRAGWCLAVDAASVAEDPDQPDELRRSARATALSLRGTLRLTLDGDGDPIAVVRRRPAPGRKTAR